MCSAPDALLAYQLGGPWFPRVGNGHREMAPHDVYPCCGVDQWIAIAVGDEEEWAGLCDVLGQAAWPQLYSSAPQRQAAMSTLGSAIEAWTRQRSSLEAFELLQSNGVPSSPVMTNRMLASDPHVAARHVFVPVEHPEIGPSQVMRAPWLFSDAPCAVRRHGPLMGQDNQYVFGELLDMTPQAVADLAKTLT